MRRPAILSAAALLLLLLASCEDKAPRFPDIGSFGLTEAVVDRPTVTSVIDAANRILGSEKISFAPGWKAPRKPGQTPVYAVSGLAKTEMMTVFVECRCVLIQVSALRAWLTAQQGDGGFLLSPEPADLLTYMLLHEAGHLAKGDELQGSAKFADTTATSNVNIDNTAEKDSENAADTYAASSIRIALAAGGERGLKAAQIAMALSHFSFNLAGHRLIDDFGGTALRKPALFWDHGFSHPNLEWRMLVVNDLIDSTETSRDLLRTFESSRFSSQNNILWQSEN